MTTLTIPEGYRVNAAGHLVPETQIKAVDKLRDDMVVKLSAQAKELQYRIANQKAAHMREVQDFLDVSAAEYDVKFGGAKGNVQLHSFDAHYRIQRSIGEFRIFDERIQAAKAQIDACIQRWSEGANDHIKALVEHAFRVNKQGHIDVNQVLSLRQLDIPDDDWKAAMDAIADSIQVTGSKPYIRYYERQDDGTYKPITMDFAKL